ncbi:MAG: hypothetical protein H6669_18740 [Ardenticatenaceae bacterium]|nr:hypothetical protein [Ardenticatenaceae bacterium]
MCATRYASYSEPNWITSFCPLAGRRWNGLTRRALFQRQSSLPTPPLPLEVLNHRLQAIGDAANVKGVLFICGINTGLATAANLRCSIQRLQAAGQRSHRSTHLIWIWPIIFRVAAADRIAKLPGRSLRCWGRTRSDLPKETLAQCWRRRRSDFSRFRRSRRLYNMLGEADMTPEQQV